MKIKRIAIILISLFIFTSGLFGDQEMTNKMNLLQQINEMKFAFELKDISVYTQLFSKEFMSNVNSFEKNKIKSELFYSLLINTLKQKNFSGFENKKIKIEYKINAININNDKGEINLELKALIKEKDQKETEETRNFKLSFIFNHHYKVWLITGMNCL